MAVGEGNPVADALNRVADALFQQAKASRAQVKLMEQQIAISAEMRDMQKVNLAVSKHLEAELAMRAGGVHGSA